MYGTDATSDSLYTVNLTTGAWTLVGATGTSAPSGMAYDSDNGVMYGVDSRNLYTVNLTTGTWTLVGATGSDTFTTVGMAYDSVNGVMYGVDSIFNSLYTVNLTTGLWTLVGGIGAPGVSGTTGIAYDSVNGVMYGVSTNTDSLYTVNLTTRNRVRLRQRCDVRSRWQYFQQAVHGQPNHWCLVAVA